MGLTLAFVAYYATGLALMWWAMHRFLRLLWGTDQAEAKFSTPFDWFVWVFCSLGWPLLVPTVLIRSKRYVG